MINIIINAILKTMLIIATFFVAYITMDSIYRCGYIDPFVSKNYSHSLRQMLNPYSEWSSATHVSDTYQYPNSIPVYKPMYGGVTQYMYAMRPSFD